MCEKMISTDKLTCHTRLNVNFLLTCLLFLKNAELNFIIKIKGQKIMIRSKINYHRQWQQKCNRMS